MSKIESNKKIGQAIQSIPFSLKKSDKMLQLNLNEPLLNYYINKPTKIYIQNTSFYLNTKCTLPHFSMQVKQQKKNS